MLNELRALKFSGRDPATGMYSDSAPDFHIDILPLICKAGEIDEIIEIVVPSLWRRLLGFSHGNRIVRHGPMGGLTPKQRESIVAGSIFGDGMCIYYKTSSLDFTLRLAKKWPLPPKMLKNIDELPFRTVGQEIRKITANLGSDLLIVFSHDADPMHLIGEQSTVEEIENQWQRHNESRRISNAEDQ